MLALSFWLARKVTTRRADIATSSPVRGLRPGRAVLSRKVKLPNPESFTALPCSREQQIFSKNNSTNSLASRLFKPTSRNNVFPKSALVTVISSFRHFNVI